MGACATAAPPRVCVTMIVKNEGHVIGRALASARRMFDAWAIVDTGSTDDTEARVREATEGWPGKFARGTFTTRCVEAEHFDFGKARTESLRLARETGCDYAFVLDADEFIEIDDGFDWPTDGQDRYTVLMGLNGIRWPQARMFRLACGWRYEGIRHETAVSCIEADTAALDGLRIGTKRDGARSQNPSKYADDARVLEDAAAAFPENKRYVFYVAQSWRDAKDHERAVEWYARRVAMAKGENTSEVVISLNEIAKAYHRLGRPFVDVRDAYLRAYGADSSRAEPLHGLAMLCREHNDWPLAWHFAAIAASKRQPVGMFVDSRVYAWLAKDELAIALANLGRIDVAIAIAEDILSHPALPEIERARIEANLDVFRSTRAR